MMQAAAFDPTVGDFNYSRGNMSVSVDSLQAGQFAIDTIFLNYGDFSSFPVKEWTLGSNLAKNYTVYNLDTSTFDSSIIPLLS